MSTFKVNPLKNTPLFEPLVVGKNKLQHRIAMAPTTRLRALEDNTPSDLALKYYEERSKTPGSLMVVEATVVAAELGGFERTPGIFTEKHAKAWKKINDAIHLNGSFSSCQLWAMGRSSSPQYLKNHNADFVSASSIYFSEESKQEAIAAGKELRSLTEEEIEHLINVVYPRSAKLALEAGFDYVEVHAAHGYLFDEFLHPSSNQRTDKYGGSIENRARFLLAVIDKLIGIVGADRLAVRLSPWAKFQGMKAEKEEVHSVVTISYVLSELQRRADAGNALAYVSLVEPRAQGSFTVDEKERRGNNEFARLIWKGPLMRSGAYINDDPDLSTLKHDAKDNNTFFGFARYYTSNPDFVERLREGLPLQKYERPTFYADNNWQYTTWPKYGEESKANKEEELKRLPQAIQA